MLKLIKIKKSYTTGDFTQVALDEIDLEFRHKEFVAILGQSGSGKTTCLNVIGGLDNYDSGDLIINGKSTKKFKDVDWDAYRNKSVGFIFQSYNLISHLSILDNVMMGMTLSGVKPSLKKKKALEVLERVGLTEHIHKNPTQLSGGQMQRVAIARALTNDPDIILADEPTGALDTKTSVQIMDLIKEVSKDKLVVMVTHNPDLAHEYADRVIEFKDGNIISDSNPHKGEAEDEDYKLKKTGMNFLTALKLSGTNIKTKIGRTLLTAFASSIGIIGIALILSLSNGFDIQIKDFESETLSNLPILISQTSMEVGADSFEGRQNQILGIEEEGDYPTDNYIYPVESEIEKVTHTNIFTNEYMDYINRIDEENTSGVLYNRLLNMNILKKDSLGEITPVQIDKSREAVASAAMSSTSGNGFTSFPEIPGDESFSYLKNNYDVLSGDYPKSIEEIILIVNKKNQVGDVILENFGFDTSVDKKIDFNDIINMEYKIVPNNVYYTKTPYGTFMPIVDSIILKDIYNDSENITLRVVGILRPKEDIQIPIIPEGFAYSDRLSEKILEDNQYSEIAKTQESSDYNVFTGQKLDLTNPADLMIKESILSMIGATDKPYLIAIFPRDFDTKDEVIEYLDNYNKNKDIEEQVIYTDLAADISDMTGDIMNAITLVLIAFSAISLVVSLIMVGIITYISVLERTKEIGILRALGARKKDITRVFNAETFIIGLSSGVLGILIARVLVFPTNMIIENATSLKGVAVLNPIHALALVLVSLILTILGGMLPAKMASRKDPVDALRTE